MANYETLLEKFFGQVPEAGQLHSADASALEVLELCRFAHTELMLRCEYNTAPRHHDVSVLPSGRFFAAGLRIREMSVAMIGIGDPRVWVREVYEPGMAVVGGRLVLAKIVDDGDAADVILVEQGRGAAIKPAYGRVTRAGQGVWELSSRADTKHPALLVFCTELPKSKEVTDETWNDYLTLRVGLLGRNLPCPFDELLGDGPKGAQDDDDVEVVSSYEN